MSNQHVVPTIRGGLGHGPAVFCLPLSGVWPNNNGPMLRGWLAPAIHGPDAAMVLHELLVPAHIGLAAAQAVSALDVDNGEGWSPTISNDPHGPLPPTIIASQGLVRSTSSYAGRRPKAPSSAGRLSIGLDHQSAGDLTQAPTFRLAKARLFSRHFQETGDQGRGGWRKGAERRAK